MAPLRTTSLLVVANLLIPMALLLFASGFFPYKPFLPGLAKYEDSGHGQQLNAPFDRIIFMVVDALRSDFVYSKDSGFKFTQSLISRGSAMPFTAHAASPTITMPRIKAITTGSIPSFLDVILNFAESDTSSTLSTQDTWLAQMKAKRTGKMVMYGDDTWLKLFPETFDRSDGTSSFFVADFTEVDNNVTRHVPEELGNDDWNTMVLHYLGLDHIGHKAGPRSSNMLPKQYEMDGIVRQIYTAMEGHNHLQNSLLVMCGDHGMNDGGNHGGSAPGETSPALVFISPKLKQISKAQESPAQTKDDFQYYSIVEQSDIAPTLAGLLGFPVPRNNLGAFIVDFLPFWSSNEDRVQLLLQNARQILKIVTATFSPSLFDERRAASSCSNSDIDKLGCVWVALMQTLKEADLSSHETSVKLILALSKWSKDAQGIMSSTASNYDLSRLMTGQVVATLASIFSFGAAFPILSRSLLSALPFLFVTITYMIMMFASSYVEEEQNFWYWATSGWLVLLSLKGAFRYIRSTSLLNMGALGALAASRVVHRWNQTGQKFAGEPDIARTFLSYHAELLWGLISTVYIFNAYSLSMIGFPRLPRLAAAILAITLMLLAITFKLAFTREDAPELIGTFAKTALNLTPSWSLIIRVRMVFQTIATCLAFTIGCELWYSTQPTPGFRNTSMRTIHNLIVLFLITQSRTTNIPLFLIFQIQFDLLKNLNISIIEITTTSLLLQYASFFAFSGSNAISSIDLSNAYNGVSGYSVLVVGLLTFASNWAGPLYWTSATNILLLRLNSRKLKRSKANGYIKSRIRSNGKMELNVWTQHAILLTLFTSCSVVGVMVACTMLRTHLFIWTVFSPKYLYSMAWAFGQHLGVNMLLGGFLFWIGSR